MKDSTISIPLARPDITEVEIAAVTDVLRTPFLSLGPKVAEFEQALARYAGVEYAVAVNSGTSALHLIVKGLGLKAGDEMITTPFSFVASANCALFEGATPVFVDIDPRTLNVDVSLIEGALTPRTRAILAVDVFGHPAEWEALERLAKRHGLWLIEDSAEAIGARYRGRMAGSFGDAAVFAFYPNKQITTGEGGVILTNNEQLAGRCRSMANQGRGKAGQWLQHERLGYNFRLSDIHCALGLAQLSRIDEILQRRSRVAQAYARRLQGMQGLHVPSAAGHVDVSWFVYVIRLSSRFTQADRDVVMSRLRDKGIACSNYFAPIHLQPPYRALGYQPGDFPVTEGIAQRTIALPFFNQLSDEQMDRVVTVLRQALESL